MNEQHTPIDWDKILESLERDQAEGKALTRAEAELLAELNAIRLDAYGLLVNYKTYHKQERWSALKAHIDQSELPGEIENTAKQSVWLWPRIAGVAVAVALIVVGVYFFNDASHPNFVSGYVKPVSNVGPGVTGATLTLASGQKIKLSDAVDGELVNEAGVKITKAAGGHLVYELKGSSSAPNTMNTLATENGETYQVRLPDGSMVWLNAASSLTYRTNLLENGKRKARLIGEAYFEIAKDSSHPFVVESNGQQIEVLGTQFNISCYAGEPIKTTLLEGAVKIGAGRDTAVLKPGQQSLFTIDGKLKIYQTNMEEAVAWKNGYFSFNEEKIRDVMRQIARWYNIDVQYAAGLTNEGFTGTISRYTNISDVLKMLQATKTVHFEVEGRRVRVTK